jgi:hypothetical protein
MLTKAMASTYGPAGGQL